MSKIMIFEIYFNIFLDYGKTILIDKLCCWKAGPKPKIV